MTTNYSILVLGDTKSSMRQKIELAITDMVADFGISVGSDLAFVEDVTDLPPATTVAAVYFGSSSHVSNSGHDILLQRGIPVLPIVSSIASASIELPLSFRKFNAFGLDAPDAPNAIAATVLENLCLMPQQRRVFISYIRAQATGAALQLFSELESRQFRVFVDTHGVRHSSNFQEELWHNLSDCDVMVMIDTSKYFESQWTREEFAKANVKKAAILRVAFPDVRRDDNLSITEDMPLASEDIVDGEFSVAALNRICDRVERLRSKSIAVRTAAIIGSVRAAVTDIRGSISPPGAMRRVEIELPSGKRVFLYPAIGVPTASLLNDVADHAALAPAAIVYDRLGVRERWLKHLSWLGVHVPQVRWMQSWEASWALAAWDAEP